MQNKAIDVVIRANDPDTIKYLIPVLKDENEYARRAAVEVLNEIGNAKSVKELLEAVSDDDWWVRSRAADALGKIGGPKVVEAVLQLVGDQDEDIRRAAVEILNQTKDDRAVGHLIEATKDKDWWVSERAVDALAEIGSKRAVPRLHRNARDHARRARCRWWCARSAAWATTRSSTPCCPCCTREEKDIRLEAITSLAKLADERRLETHPRADPGADRRNAEQTVAQAALRALSDLDSRFSVSGTRLSSTQNRPQLLDAVGARASPGRRHAGRRARRIRRSPRPRRRRHRGRDRRRRRRSTAAQPARTLLMSETGSAARGQRSRGDGRARRSSTSRRSSPATSSKAATSTSNASARARSARCC